MGSDDNSWIDSVRIEFAYSMHYLLRLDNCLEVLKNTSEY